LIVPYFYLLVFNTLVLLNLQLSG